MKPSNYKSMFARQYGQVATEWVVAALAFVAVFFVRVPWLGDMSLLEYFVGVLKGIWSSYEYVIGIPN